MKKNFKIKEEQPIRLGYYLSGIVALWSILIGLSLAWNLRTLKSGILEAARIEARTAFEKDIVYRRWNADYGGVYAPVTEGTQPNPYLDVPERDITTSLGKKLTMINPAYMTRQVHELALKAYGVRGHITSLNPIRPANAPDPWETRALKAFQTGLKEVSSVEEAVENDYMRLMRPLLTEKGCLKCHAAQGYKLGDIRGGISVSIPMAPLMAIGQSNVLTSYVLYGLLWLTGLVGIGFGISRLNQQIHKRIEIEKSLRESEIRYCSLFEHMINGFAYCKIVLDKNNRPIDFVYIDVNDSFESLTGLKKEDVLGKNVTEAIPTIKDSHPELFDIYGKVALTGERTKFEIYFKPLDIWLSISVYSPKKGYFVAVFENITDRKQAEEALRESEEKYRGIFDESIAAIYLFDDKKNFLDSNQAGRDLLGYSREELLNMSIPDVDADPIVVLPAHEQLLGGERIINYEHRLKRKDDKVITVLNNSRPITDTDGHAIGMQSTLIDITERKRTEEALRESEEKYRSLVESTEDSIYLVDKNCNYMFMNQKHLSRFGMSINEILGRNYAEFHSAEETKAFVEKVRQTIESGESVSYEYESERDGRYFIRTLSPVRKPAGEINAVTVISKDITERKKAEEALETHAHILENLAEGVHVSDENAIISYANQAFETMFGYEPGELIGKHASILKAGTPEESERVVKKILQQLMARRAWAGELDNVRKDGTPFPTRAFVSAIEISGKKNWVTVQEDITERKQAEEALRESENKYRSLFESSKDAVYITSREGTVIDTNQSFLDLFGYSREEIKGLNIQDIYVNPEERSVFQREIEQREFVKDYELMFHKKDGQEIDCLVTATVRHADDGTVLGYQGIIRDVTEQKRVAEALRHSTEKLLKEHSQRKVLSKKLIELLEKDRQQIAMELHDHIGQTLTSLKMNLEMIHEKLKPTHTELVTQITVAQERAIQAIRDVKDISHGLRPTMIDSLGVVSSLRELFDETQQQTDIEIQFFSHRIPKRFEMEKELSIYRIVQEALNNIINHAKAKKVFVNLIKKDKKLSLSVEDDGVGFDQDKTMKPLKREELFGLLIMRERAAQIDGEFTIESQPGKGTHLLVEIPL